MEEITRTVNNDFFTYEFKESLKAYHTEFYPAAGATAGIALENLLRILIKQRTGPAFLPENTYIRDSNRVLKKHNIVDGRIAASPPIRNSTSHTNTRRVDKETAEEA